jgi:subtilisin family serine protease
MVTSKSGHALRALAAALVAAALAAPIAVQAAPKYERVIVVYKAGAAQVARDAVSRAGGRVVLDLGEVNAVAVRLPAGAVEALRAHPGVEAIEADPERHVMGSRSSGPSRALAAEVTSEQVPYGTTMVQSDKLVYQPAGSRKVCIIDSGYDLAHEDLQKTTVTGVNLSGSGDWSTDEAHHGTHVSGTIAALGGNGIGVVGVVRNGKLPLQIVKVFDSSGSASSSVIIKGVLQCKKAKANVISMSLGGGRPTNFEQKIYDNLAANGVLVVAAAGNGGTSDISYPAGYASVMSVAAIDSNKVHASFSQFNADVEIAAPGVHVLSTVPMGTGSDTSLSVGGVPYQANPTDGPLGSATAALYNFGTGEADDAGVAGKVCLIQRGNISFADKVTRCESNGGVAAVIYNNVSGNLNATLGGAPVTIPSATVSLEDGTLMLGQLGQSTTLALTPSNYAYFDGTSMATPHVSSVAALVWSYFPTCTGAQIRSTLTKTAMDLGDPGRDDLYGAGLVQAKAAYDRIKSMGCVN